MPKDFFVTSNWRRRLERAAWWRARADQSVQIENSSELREWLKSKENRSAYNEVIDVWKVLEDHKQSPAVLAIRRRAMRNAQLETRKSRMPGFAFAAAVACCAMLLATSLVWNPLLGAKPVTYVTGIGEHKIINLEDGSRITMDSSTVVRTVRFSRNSRAFVLQSGRARFDVAHDLSRPFTVAAGGQTVIAVGTAFSVERLSAKTLVTLDDGLVVVRSPALSDKMPERSVWLSPGQELIATRSGNIAVSSVDLKASDAWRHGQIVFSDERLDETVEQVNRYLTVPLEVDPAVANMRVSGVFNVRNLDSFVSSLMTYFPLESKVQNGRVMLEKRD